MCTPPSLASVSLPDSPSPLSVVALVCQVMEICLQAQLEWEQQSWLPGDSFQSDLVAVRVELTQPAGAKLHPTASKLSEQTLVPAVWHARGLLARLCLLHSPSLCKLFASFTACVCVCVWARARVRACVCTCFFSRWC